MSAELVNLVLRARAEIPVSHTGAWAVLLVLADYTNDSPEHPLNGSAWPSEATIGAQIKATERSVRTYLQELEHLKLIHLVERRRRDSARWELNAPLLREFVMKAETGKICRSKDIKTGKICRSNGELRPEEFAGLDVQDRKNLHQDRKNLPPILLVNVRTDPLRDPDNKDQGRAAGQEIHFSQKHKTEKNPRAERTTAEVRAEMAAALRIDRARRQPWFQPRQQQWRSS